jgi:diketogulonate reductase-like aldo/keto reductase
MTHSRRSILKGLGFGVGLAAGGLRLPTVGAATSSGEILMRAIPASGERIPAVGLGTARTFDVGDVARAGSESLDRLREVLRVFHESGGRLVDASPMYGTAEELVGRFAGELGLDRELFMATKVWTTGREAGIEQMQQSMRLLGREPIDMMQIHNLVDWRTHYHTLREWQDAGRIRYIGVSHYLSSAHEEVEKILKSERFDMFQINYNVLDRNAEKRLLPLALDRGMAVLANVPFGTGRIFSRARGESMPAWAAEFDAGSWAQLFLKFILGHPAITCAIPATTNPRHVADNVGAAYGRLPDEAGRARIVSWLEQL